MLPRVHPVLRRLASNLPAAQTGPSAAEPVSCWLVQDAASGQLRLQAEPAGPRQVGLGEPLRVDAGGLGIRIDGITRPRLSTRDLPADIVALERQATLQLETADEVLTVATVQRPRGAAGWACGWDAVTVTSPRICGKARDWSPAFLSIHQQSGSGWFKFCAQAFGKIPVRTVVDKDTFQDSEYEIHLWLDAEFGVAADLFVTTRRGQATQRFRYIEPGTFLMGSPGSEEGRGSDEGPQHLVTISRGFWLADTACTQALWQAVMGKNPSHFKGENRPVENVSWHDVQSFLRQLEELLPGCGADLPTEAEWEYACRAGTPTPFSFGDSVTREQVNYRGDAGETVPVKSLPPNPWALYEMHGNVWEWCADGLRHYDAAPQRDPKGPESEDAPRVIRGGSWLYEAGLARSAFRGADHPGGAYHALGFRFCLRSIEPSQEPGRPGGPAGRAPGRRPPASPRDEAKPARKWDIRRLLRRKDSDE
ncbi:MAG: SUMF1/EgtB/PvdO family nonheme iron enzyme [Alphaproteobacteria bacterium]|nr:SUMF1/EgtB/PvdO family nonheme iron enzyme [Alphaproteobacteria bacterium]